MKPTTAMVLAAGLGTRMRPLTNDRPKALVEVGGEALIDHMLSRLADAGVTTAVVNVHAFADRLEAHLSARTAAPRIVISDERAQLLETGGGLRKARPLLGDDPVFVANIDAVWTEDGAPALDALAAAYARLRQIEHFVPGRRRAQIELDVAAAGEEAADSTQRDKDCPVESRRIRGHVARHSDGPHRAAVDGGVHGGVLRSLGTSVVEWPGKL